MIINGHFAFFCLKSGKTTEKCLSKVKQNDKVNPYAQKFCRKNRRLDARRGSAAMDGCMLEIHDLPGELGMYVRTIEGE